MLTSKFETIINIDRNISQEIYMEIKDANFCRLKTGQFCSEHFCDRCYIWVIWDVVLQEARENLERKNKGKGGEFSGPALLG